MRNTFNRTDTLDLPIPNYWDGIAMLIIMGLIVALCLGADAMLGHYQLGTPIHITLNPHELPYYALRSVLRMFVALLASLAFTFIFGTWAAKSRHAEKIIIPFIDIMQSVPVLGFLPIAAVVFVGTFANSMLGPEMAAIFAIFTAQVWNMALSLYQSLRSVPGELIEAGKMFQLSAWQRYWKIEVPFAMPGLIWNAMISMSASWVFLVASEAITINHVTITLPGIGSYIGMAIADRNIHAIIYVIITMLVVIALYDQIIFRPLVAWAEKFKAEMETSEVVPSSWVLTIFQRGRFFQWIGTGFGAFSYWFVNGPWGKRHRSVRMKTVNVTTRRLFLVGWYVVFVLALTYLLYTLGEFIFQHTSLDDVLHVFYLGCITALRVTIMIVLSSIIWVPIGVWVGLNPRVSAIVQPLVQFLAAFPANLLFPIVVLAIVHYNLNVDIWTSPLIILGAQWYILFNVIAGTMALPKNLQQAVGTLNVRGWLWWKRFILPGIFPYYITGAITAAGGAWNLSIIAEAVSWGHTQIYAHGLGAYITRYSNEGDFHKLALGVVVMSLMVLFINRTLWRPLYNLAVSKFQIN